MSGGGARSQGKNAKPVRRLPTHGVTKCHLRYVFHPSDWAAPPRGFFNLAECDIPAGQEVLHSYGDLGDAALLQTYGFVDAAIGTEDEPFVNPCNHVLIPFQSIQRVCRQMNKDQGDDDSGFSKAKKVGAGP